MLLHTRHIIVLAMGILSASLALISPSGAAQAAGEKFLVGFAQDDMSLPWRAQQVYALRDALAGDDGIQFIHTDAQGSDAKAASDIETLVDRGIDLLVVSPKNQALLTPVISRVYDAGIPVVLITRHTMNDKYTTFIAPDDLDIARRAAEELAQAMNGKGRILVIRGPANATTVKYRTQGFLEVMANYPDLEIADVVDGYYSKTEAMRVMASVLDQQIKFDAIYAQSDEMADGARLVMSQQGYELSAIPTVGIDYTTTAKLAIADGTQLASFTYPLCAAEAADAIRDILDGRTVPRKIEVKSIMVTANNIDQVAPIF